MMKVVNLLTKNVLVLLFVFFSWTKDSNAQFVDDTQSYGLKLGLNYSLAGTTSSAYLGGVMPTFGLFYSHQFSDNFNMVSELGYSGIRFKQSQSDTRYNYDYLDANLFFNYYPSFGSKDLSFIFGVKPHYLINYNTQFFQFGTYLTATDPQNKNQKGELHVSGILGLSIAMSPIVNLELLFTPSFNNNTTMNNVQGRPSVFEVGLRFNAINIKNQLNKGLMNTKQQIQYYHQGAMLVMLGTPNKAELDALSRLGRGDEIDLVYQEMAFRNKKIANAFKDKFTYTPVYFFYDTSAYKVTNGLLKGVLLNNELKPDESVVLPDSMHFFVAGFVEDISKYTDKTHFGLYVYNNQMIQLEKPFNVPSQQISPVRMALDEDIVKYYSKQRNNYSSVPFFRYVQKFNSRLLKYIID